MTEERGVIASLALHAVLEPIFKEVRKITKYKMYYMWIQNKSYIIVNIYIS